MKKENLVRLNVMMNKEIVELFDELARMTGLSRSALFRGVLMEALPNLQSLAQHLEGFSELTEAERLVRLARLERIGGKLHEGVTRGVEML